MALFGNKEWYFLTPRERKYPNGNRPNRAAATGYWKATGADKPVTPEGRSTPVGIKKALVFYSGEAPVGVKTNWIMHEYRLAGTDTLKSRNTNTNSCKSSRSAKNRSLRLDDWVLCRLYNKKNNWENERGQHLQQIYNPQNQLTSRGKQSQDESFGDSTDSFEAVEETSSETETRSQLLLDDKIKEDNDWLMDDINFDYINNFLETAPNCGNAVNISDIPPLSFLPDIKLLSPLPTTPAQIDLLDF